MSTAFGSIESWFAKQGWEPLEFQREVWNLQRQGASGLLHSSTGTGKTLAAWLGFVSQAPPNGGPYALWITPLRALAEDTALALNRPLPELGVQWRVDLRTGDTASSAKQVQLKDPPGALVTTPETASLLLSLPEAESYFQTLQMVVVDEWHELMGSKRGTLVELALARFRKWNPNLMVWGLSATLGNLGQAASVLKVDHMVKGHQEKNILIQSLMPENIVHFPWAGHLGAQMMPRVAEQIENCRSALIFTNTRSQAEIWYQGLQMLLPELGDRLAIHHGSLDRATRERVEDGLRSGDVQAVVCTSTLDLGVDFSPVEKVFQIGSPKGVGRLIQRAGRSGHRPGEQSSVTIVPTHALEMVDIAALRVAVAEKRVESRNPPPLPLDVLVQHMVTIALGGGFESQDLKTEVRSTHAFANLTDEEWNWCLQFITKGGSSLQAYEGFHRVAERNGRYLVKSRRIAMQHRMAIGTIVSDSMVRVAFLRGKPIGTLEESFVSRLRKGDQFVFAGRSLEFVMLRDMTCYVRPARTRNAQVVRWMGAKMSLSTELSDEMRIKLDEAAGGILHEPEMQFSHELLQIQDRWSRIPARDELLAEMIETREGHHLFLFPIEGRQVHEGLASLFAYRIGKIRPISFTLSANDYGFEMLSVDPIPFEEAREEGLLSSQNLFEDIAGSINSAELARRQFREIARVAGLVFQGFPGAPRSSKQIQASSGLLFDVFTQYDPENLLVAQASREVMERQLERSRFADVLRRMESSKLCLTQPPRPTPFAFPLLAARFRETQSSESAEDRIKKMIASLEKSAAE